MYVEMTDHISSRRQTANSFFLTLNSAIVTFISYANFAASKEQQIGFLFYGLVAIAGMILSYLWYRLVLSYKQINSGRFAVIHEIEDLLPLRPYKAEWIALGKGRRPDIYKPFTHIEILVPWVFFAIHVVIFVASLYLSLRNP